MCVPINPMLKAWAHWEMFLGGALRPSEERTYLHQVNPINNKRLLNMKSRSWGTPDGSAFHPLTDTQNMHGIRSERVSADGVPDGSIISETAALRKGLPLLFAGGAGTAALAPGEAQAAQDNAGGSPSWKDEITRGPILGTRNVLEGPGSVSDTFARQRRGAAFRIRYGACQPRQRACRRDGASCS